jgi:DNA recombination protein RmuC
MLTGTLIFLFGLAIGGFLVWLFFRSRLQTTAADGQKFQEEQKQRIAAEARAERIPELEGEKCALNAKIDGLQHEVRELSSALSRSETQTEEQRKAAEAERRLVHAAKEELTLSFQNIADKIFEEKSRNFNQVSSTNLEGLLKPFGVQIKDFEKKVNDVYSSEARERFSLEKEVRKLAELNLQISQDAINLTNALKGQTRVQGELGQIILETVLEKTGLVKNQEYVIQKSLTNEEGQRFRPDVIVYLPDNRQLIIDSKVNLPTYQEYCSLSDGPQRELVLKKHVAAFRKHVSDLDLRRYQDLHKLSSLDFVLMFVPFEGSFSIAMQSDAELFNYAFEKNVVIVTPFTLGATIRTIANVWKHEYQSQNAFKIAKQAGRLYDKFNAFVTDLADIGKKLDAARESYDLAHNKLISGRGNIVNRIESLKLLGARAKKDLPQVLVAEAFEEESAETIISLAEPKSTPRKPELSPEESAPLFASRSASGQG